MRIKSYPVFLILISLLFTFPASGREKKTGKVDFSLHIFSSNNLTGNIEPCG